MTIRARTSVVFAALACVVVLSGCGRSGTTSNTSNHAELAARLDSMVATERAFSAYAQSAGIRDAFLRHLARDAVVFEPLPVPAAGRVEQWGPTDWVIAWEPTYAEISAAGDLGWDTGPCDIRPPASAKRDTIHGQFNSVWRRDVEGTWRLVADLGVDVSPPVALYGRSEYRAGPLPGAAKAATRGDTAPDLLALDRELGESTSRSGIGGALARVMAPEGRLHQHRRAAAVGPDAVLASLDSVSGAWHLVPAGSGVSRSHDLGYSYGVIEHTSGAEAAVDAPDSSVYPNVWKRLTAGDWRLTLAVVKPLR